MDESSPEQLVDLPPSAKLVFKTLEYTGTPLTQQQLVAHSRLGARTTRHALTRLKSVGLIEEEINFADVRQSIYYLSLADGKVPERSQPPTADD